MNSAALHTKWQRFRNSLFRHARLCRILVSRCIDQAGRLLREHRNRPTFNRFTGQPVPKPRFTRKLQYLWFTSKLWLLRFCRLFVKYPGWTIATMTGCIGIILLLIVQIAAFFPKSASDAQPLMEPFIEITDVDGANKNHNSTKVEVFHDDSANGHPSQFETSAQPVFDIDVVLFPLRGVQEYPEQFLVTSVSQQHPLNQIPIRTGNSRWKAFSLNRNRIVIQPTDYLSQGFRIEQNSAESFVEPSLSKPAHNSIQYPTSDILSSASTTTVTTAETTTEQAKTEVTAKLKMIVGIDAGTQLGQPERIQFQIVNEGRISATNVILGIEIPKEFTYSKGRSLEYKVGTIRPGETRIARLTPKAAKTGVAVFQIELTADEGFSHILEQQIEVVSSD